MSDNVVVLPVLTTLDIPAERVLQGAILAGLESVVVVGVDKDGNEYAASSHGAAEAVWMMERAKLNLLRSDDE